MLHSIAAWTLAAMCAASIFFFVRSWWFDDQLERVAVESTYSREQHLVREGHVRLSSSRGRLTLTVMKNITPHPPMRESKVAWTRGPQVTRWHWSHFPDDLPAARRASKKWERRVVFEYG